MTPLRDKYNRYYYPLTIVILCITVGVFIGKYSWLYARVALASAHTEHFEKLRKWVKGGNVEEAIWYLEDASQYYPSGTIHREGSRLNIIVEREREWTIGEIIEHLRAITGEDLGDDPEVWIEKYKIE